MFKILVQPKNTKTCNVDPSKLDHSALVFEQTFQPDLIMFHLVPHANPAKHVAGNEQNQYLLCLIQLKIENRSLISEQILQLVYNLHQSSKM